MEAEALMEMKKSLPLLESISTNPQFLKSLNRSGYEIDYRALDDFIKIVRNADEA